MLFRLSVKNMKKSFKDYAIYFVTLILGVAIFYVFNSMDSQQAMEVISSSTYDIMKLMIQMLSGMSVFISFILGFLIVYANNFLIKRRKQEFGIYLTLGMGKGQISRILLSETFLIGLVSLAVGLLLGIFGAQFMSLLVVKMFGGVMDGYQFVFSRNAFFKTILYFTIMFAIVAVFNVVSISKCRLIKLLSARKQNEQVKMKNPVFCFLVFLVALIDLGIQYYLVCHPDRLEQSQVGMIILAGCIGTFLFFWSLSGFLLNVVQKSKRFYLRDLNAFVLRQIHSKVNTMVFSMTVICLMLFVTICVLAGGLGLNSEFQKMLGELTPVDANYSMYYSEEYGGNEQAGQKLEALKQEQQERGVFASDAVQVTIYRTEQLTMKDTMGKDILNFTAMMDFPAYKMTEQILKVSDYNKIAKLYGAEQLEVPAHTYAVVSDYEMFTEARNPLLKEGYKISLDGQEYTPAYPECKYGFLEMMANHANSGIIILPDDSVKEEWKNEEFLAVNYQGETRDELSEVEDQAVSLEKDGILFTSKIQIVEVSGGLSATVTFVAIYLGIIFLISSAAILALKELSESSDNRERYDMLRKIGADEKIISRALFSQTALFFFLPLLVALIHSVFGMTFIGLMLESMGKIGSLSSILTTAGILLVIYGGYFLITYSGSKRIIKNS